MQEEEEEEEKKEITTTTTTTRGGLLITYIWSKEDLSRGDTYTSFIVVCVFGRLLLLHNI
jgi:hypothetical protein